MTTFTARKRCGCKRGARRGSYSADQCRLCWHEINTPGWLAPVPVPPPETVDCCGGKVVTLNSGPVVWSYGVTTVPQRHDLLQRTLASLALGGFGEPQVFSERGYGAFSTWWLSLLELYLKEPWADRYAIFQDDVACVRNLRQYLDRVPHPERGYWNLFTTRENEEIAKQYRHRPGWYEASLVRSTSNTSKLQTGRGALGLVFPRHALVELLMSRHLVERPIDGVQRNIDGCVVTALNKAGYREYVHAPSLLQHTGDDSVISATEEAQQRQLGMGRRRVAKSFPGENFDALNFLEKKTV